MSCTTHIIGESDLFHPRRTPIPLDIPGRRMVDLTLDDGTVIRGWHLTAPLRNRTLIYCYGNAETLLDIEPTLEWLANAMECNVLAFDYRGYGFSEGTPTFAALTEDGLAMYDHLRSMEPRQPIFVYGRSIGTAMATRIAAERPVAGLILEAPPTSIAEVIPTWSSRIPWYARVAVGSIEPDPAIADYRPQPIDNIRRVTAPLLVIHGELDDIIGIEFGRKMLDAAASQQKHWCPVSNAGHNDLWIQRPPVSDSLRAFVAAG